MKLILRAQKIVYRAIILFLVIGSLVMGCLHKGAASDCGLNGVETLDDVYNLPWYLTMHGIPAMRDDRNRLWGGQCHNYCIDKANWSYKAIRECHFTRIYCDRGTSREEGFSAGKTGYIFDYFGFSYISGQIKYMNTLNLMQTGEEYLAFLEPSPLNSYQNISVYTLTSSLFGYIKVGPAETGTLPSDYQTLSFAELTDYAFFSVCPEITEYLNQSYMDLLTTYVLMAQ